MPPRMNALAANLVAVDADTWCLNSFEGDFGLYCRDVAESPLLLMRAKPSGAEPAVSALVPS